MQLVEQRPKGNLSIRRNFNITASEPREVGIISTFPVLPDTQTGKRTIGSQAEARRGRAGK